MMDKQQIELIGTAWLEAKLVKEGFEVARPIRDSGIDLIVYTDVTNNPFHAVPIQLKSATSESFSLSRKYMGRGIIMAFVWNILDDSPRLFIIPFELAVELLSEKTRQTNSWAKKGEWHCSKPSKVLMSLLEEYENNFDILRCKAHL